MHPDKKINQDKDECTKCFEERRKRHILIKVVSLETEDMEKSWKMFCPSCEVLEDAKPVKL
jgi:hypothetical protein